MTTRYGSLALILLIGSGAEVGAQLVYPVQISNRVFDRGRIGSPNRRSLNLSSSLYGAYDTDVLAGLTDRRVTSGATTSGGLYGGAVALDFRQPGPVDVGLSGQTGASYAPAVPGSYRTGYTVSGDASSGLTLTRRMSAEFSGRTGYQSQADLSSQAFTGQDPAFQSMSGGTLEGVELTSRSIWRQEAEAAVGYEVSRRGRLQAGYSANISTFPGLDSGRLEQGATVTYRHEIGRHVNTQFGYRYGQSRHQIQRDQYATFSTRGIIANVEYNRDLTPHMSRSTYVNFRVGTTTASQQPREAPGSSSHRAYLVASAGLSHELGRTWSAQANYSRDLRYLDGFGEPLISDGVSARVGGALSERVGFSASSRYARGSGVSLQTSSRFSSFQSTAQVQYVVNTKVGLFFQAYHSTYDSAGQTLALSLLVPDQLSRLGVRVGVNLWTPLLN